MLGELESPPTVLYLDEAGPRARARSRIDGETADTAAGDPGVHPLHVGHDQGSEGRHAHARLVLREAHAGRALAGCSAGTTGSGAPPGPAGRSRSGTFCSAPGALGRRSFSTRAASTRRSGSSCSPGSGSDVLCQAPTEFRLMAKARGLEHVRPVGDQARRLRGRAAESRGDPCLRGRVRRHDPRWLRADREHTARRQLPGHADPPGLDGPAFAGARGGGHRRVTARRFRPARRATSRFAGARRRSSAGYWEAPEETAAVFRGEWYVTGDRATRDEDGYFWFAGRADDVILSAAYRIGPFEVESALLEHEAVAESAVVGKPDPDRGQIVKAFVVLRPGLRGGRRADPRAPGAREASHRSLQVPARDRVRGRASEDPQRQDPPRRAARGSRSSGRGSESLTWRSTSGGRATTACAATCSC